MNYTNQSYLYIAKALSPVHSGGARGNSIADFAIQKEARDNIPKIDSSSWKGSVLNNISSKAIIKKDKNSIFYDLVFSDLKLLFFPVRSSSQSFLFVTSFERLETLLDLLKASELQDSDRIIESLEIILKDRRYYSEKDVIHYSERKFLNLGHCSYSIKSFREASLDSLTVLSDFIEQPMNKIVIMPHIDFIDMVNYELEYVTRVRLNEDRVSVEQNLLVEEYLPEESILYGFITHFYNILKTSEENDSEQFMKQEIPHTVQIGKNSILGKGMIKLERWEDRKWKVE